MVHTTRNAKISKLYLLILDEWVHENAKYMMDDFFEIIRHRYENGSLIITTNRNLEDWGALFGDKLIASAIIDRIDHHPVIVKLTGTSYRVKNLIEVQDMYKKEETQYIKRGRPKKYYENGTDKDQDQNFENE